MGAKRRSLEPWSWVRAALVSPLLMASKYGAVFDENMMEAVVRAAEGEAVEAHADGDVFFERLHGGDEIGVERSLRNAEVEHEIGIGAVGLAIGGVAQKI